MTLSDEQVEELARESAAAVPSMHEAHFQRYCSLPPLPGFPDRDEVAAACGIVPEDVRAQVVGTDWQVEEEFVGLRATARIIYYGPDMTCGQLMGMVKRELPTRAIPNDPSDIRNALGSLIQVMAVAGSSRPNQENPAGPVDISKSVVP